MQMKNKKSNKQLTDSDIINLYWEVFNKCEILDNGSIIKFNLTCFKGKKTLSYLVPMHQGSQSSRQVLTHHHH